MFSVKEGKRRREEGKEEKYIIKKLAADSRGDEKPEKNEDIKL